MRSLFAGAVLFFALAAAEPAFGQMSQRGWPGVSYRGGYYASPGYYGVSWGYPSMGFPRTYSVFSSPFGPGYGNGYGPSSVLPGYGMGLWRPGYAVPGYMYTGSYYGMYPARYWPTWNGGSPWIGGYGGPVGVYAPYAGPNSFYAW